MEFKNLTILLCFIYFTVALQNVCYEGNLKFGDESCLHNLIKEIPTDVLEGKRLCKDIACMPYLKSFEAYICFQQKINEIKYTIVYKDRKKKSFEIPVFQENESYMLKRVAISGTAPTNSHITLRLISGELAYRLAFNYKDLGVKNDQILVQRLGPNNRVFWQPFFEYDKYVIIDYENEGLSENFKEYHNNTLQNSPIHDEEVSLSKESAMECSDWSTVIPEITTTTLVSSTIKTIAVSEYKESNILMYLIIAIIVIIIFCCGAAIALPVFCYLNQKKKVVDLNPVVNDSNIVPVEQRISPQQTAVQLLNEPPLPELPPITVNEEVQNNGARVEQLQILQHQPPLPLPQLPNPVLTPPPSYRTNESAQMFGQMFVDFMHYMSNNLGNRNSNNNVMQRLGDIVEMQPLTRPSQNELAFE